MPFSREKVQGIWDSENDDEVKCREIFFPSRACVVPSCPYSLLLTQSNSPPLTFERQDDNSSNFTWNGPHFVCSRLDNLVSFRPGLVHIMTYCNNPHERTNPIEIFFFGHIQSRPDRPDAARIPMPCSPNHLTYAFQQLRSILVSTSEKKVSFGLLSFTTRSSSFGDSLCITSTPPPAPIPPTTTNPSTRMERIHFSAALHSSSPRSVYIITTQFVLRSSPFLGIAKADPNHSCPPPCRTMFHACV